jgi:hypothetical protein
VAGFLDQAGESANRGILHGKIGGAIASPTGRCGGQEAAALSMLDLEGARQHGKLSTPRPSAPSGPPLSAEAAAPSNGTPDKLSPLTG